MGQDKSQRLSGGPDDGLFRLVCAGLVAIVTSLAVQKVILIVQYHWLLSAVIAVNALSFLSFYLFAVIQNRKRKKEKELGPTQNASGAVYFGKEHGSLRPFYFQEEHRRGHLQVLAPTNTGKTASVILPMAVSDMKEGRGFIMVDGKGDADFRNQLYAYAEKSGRKEDFMVFSISDPDISATFNPLYGGTPEEITQRMFSALEFQDEYYKSIQFQASSDRSL
jgi:type IV secretory pathway TraG/TraD family ATPase VirD4